MTAKYSHKITLGFTGGGAVWPPSRGATGNRQQTTNNNISLFLGLLLLLFTGCKEAPVSSKPGQSPAESFQSLLEETVAANEGIPGIMASVEAPGLGISWAGAAGVSDVKAGSALQPGQPFRIASVTKTFVAAAILRLYEEGRLSLEDPVNKYISEEHAEILRQGGYEPGKITIRHLLNHTSGLFDYCFGSAAYVNRVKQDPHHRWARAEQLKGAMEWGKPYGAPGEGYHYSDTGYILLGEVLETITGGHLGQAIRELTGFERLGIRSTWLESFEEPPAGLPGRVHQYLEDTDTYGWDPSMDLYGGGGLVSTSSDLARFFYQLFENKVYSQPATLEAMLAKTEFSGVEPAGGGGGAPGREDDYRLGIGVVRIYNTENYMHTGYWGTQVVYLPEYHAAIAINFIKGGNYLFLKKVISILAELDMKQG